MQHWEIWEVVDKKTKKLIQIKDYRFDSSLYEYKRKVGYGGVEQPNVYAYKLDNLLDEAKEKPASDLSDSEEVGEEVLESKHYCAECDKEFKREQDFKTHNTKYHSE